MINSVLITGCAQGFGKALVEEFSRVGCRVYAVGRSEQELNELAASSPHICPILADITLNSGRTAIATRLAEVQAFSIIHNAAIAQPCQFESMDETLLRKHLETNLLAPLLMTHELLPHLVPGQRILNISSGAANLPLPGLMPYCVSKAAMQLAMQCLNLELISRGIHCANLRPGLLDTRMQAQLRAADLHQLPNRDFYRDAKKSRQLILCEIAAIFTAWVMLKTEATCFGETLWDIYDNRHHAAWLSPRKSLYD